MKERAYTLRSQPRSLPIEFEAELNPEQKAVVTAPDEQMLILAGAGSGKTRVLVFRVAYLLQKGILPESIMLVTFTNKAAREMLERVKKILGGSLTGIWGGTFHHIGNRILRRYSDLLQFPSNFAILDREDSKFLLNDCAAELGIRTKNIRFPKGDVLQDILSFAVNCGKNIEEVLQERYPYYRDLTPEIDNVFKRYESRKRNSGLMDFDDLLFNWHKLLTGFPSVLEKISSRFKHILVDEYQDTNWLQAQILAQLAGQKHSSIVVVGDDAQSIYSFRGAVFQNILDFPEQHPGTKIYKLETNYRSTPDILNLANQIISQNQKQFEKNLKSVRKNGMPPAIVPARNPDEQASFIAQRILELRDEGYDLSQMAVLYRAHYQSAELELEFMRRNIPYEMRSGLRFFEQAHIKDVLAFLRILHNPKDELSWKRIFRVVEGVGIKTSQKIWEKIKEQEDPVRELQSSEILLLLRKGTRERLESLSRLLQEMEAQKNQTSENMNSVLLFYDDYMKSTFKDYRERKLDLEELSHFALRYETIETFLSDIALQEGMSGEDILLPDEKEEGAVVLSTIHRAKGLEWRAVFIPWLSEGHFPLSYAYGNSDAIEEERRLLYVAVTRAKDQIYLLYPRFTHEEKVIHRASPFIVEIPENLCEQWVIQ